MSIILQLKYFRCCRSFLFTHKSLIFVDRPFRSRTVGYKQINISDVPSTPFWANKLVDKTPVPENFNLVYNIGDYVGLKLIKFSIFTLSASLLYALYNHISVKNDPETEPSEQIKENDESLWGYLKLRVKEYLLMSKVSPPLNMTIVFCVILGLIQLRTKVVLRSYRKDKRYITELTNYLGSRVEVNHNIENVKYYSKRKLFQHEIHGKKVIFFEEFFSNKYEWSLLSDEKSLEEK